MLELIWFMALMALSAVLAVIYTIKEDEGFEAAGWLIGALFSAEAALVISWEKTGAVALSILRETLPQSGTTISDLTAYALTGLLCLFLGISVPVASSFLTALLRRNQGKSE